MSIRSFFSPRSETKELHAEQELRTRYYRNTFKQCLEAVKAMAEEKNLEVRDVNMEHGEVYLLGFGYDVITTITKVTPIEVGIDFKVNFFTTFGFNRPKNKISELYDALDDRLNFKGVSLHP